MRRLPVILVALLGALALTSQGCAELAAVNRSFAVTSPEARDALRQMADDPKPLERPVVVLGGFADPGIGAPHLAGDLRKVLGEHDDVRIITVSFPFALSFDECRDKVIEAVDEAFPTDDPLHTAEVDVVGISMGGLVGRYAAAPGAGGDQAGRRLRVRRLFTVSSPHRGARMAILPLVSFGSLQFDMRSGSDFLTALAEHETASSASCGCEVDQPPASHAYADYELYPYVRLGDGIVGAENAAPEGCSPIWLANLPLQDAHMLAASDARIVADIARRLRGEPPFATDPPEPLPGVDVGEVEAQAAAR